MLQKTIKLSMLCKRQLKYLITVAAKELLLTKQVYNKMALRCLISNSSESNIKLHIVDIAKTYISAYFFSYHRRLGLESDHGCSLILQLLKNILLLYNLNESLHQFQFFDTRRAWEASRQLRVLKEE